MTNKTPRRVASWNSAPRRNALIRRMRDQDSRPRTRCACPDCPCPATTALKTCVACRRGIHFDPAIDVEELI